jgi:hypothetical protein
MLQHRRGLIPRTECAEASPGMHYHSYQPALRENSRVAIGDGRNSLLLERRD